MAGQLLYAVEVPEAPQRETRFETFEGAYNGVESLRFVTSRNAWTKPQMMCRQIVDDLHEAAAAGKAPKYCASAQVVCYHPDTKRWEVVYTGKAKEQPRAQRAAPKNAQDGAGFWHVVPTVGFHQTQRGVIFRAGFTGADGYPKAVEIEGNTEWDVIDRLFHCIFAVHQEYVRGLPFSTPEDVEIAEAEVAAANAPKIEKVYSAAELAAVPALDFKEYQLMRTDEIKRKYLFEPLFKAAMDKMFAGLEAAEAERKKKLAEQEEANQLAAMRKKYIEDGGSGNANA